MQKIYPAIVAKDGNTTTVGSTPVQPPHLNDASHYMGYLIDLKDVGLSLGRKCRMVPLQWFASIRKGFNCSATLLVPEHCGSARYFLMGQTILKDNFW